MNPFEKFKTWVLNRFEVKGHRVKAEIARDLAPIIAEAVTAAMEEYARGQDAKADAWEKESG